MSVLGILFVIIGVGKASVHNLMDQSYQVCLHLLQLEPYSFA